MRSRYSTWKISLFRYFFWLCKAIHAPWLQKFSLFDFDMNIKLWKYFLVQTRLGQSASWNILEKVDAGICLTYKGRKSKLLRFVCYDRWIYNVRAGQIFWRS